MTIPEYFRKYINPDIDLDKTPKICCPFHEEDTPSFSYSAERGVWRCFGACHCGGDVYDLHRKNKHFKTRQEAINDLTGGKGIEQSNDYYISDIDKRVMDLNFKISLEQNIDTKLKLIDEVSKWKI